MKRISLLVSSFVLAAALALSVGCAKKLDDAKMSSDIQSKFSQDSGLASKQLTVQANDGVVTLSGMVDNEAQREAAGKQAASIAGVRTVVNNLQVGTASAAAATAPTTQPEKPAPAVSAPPADKPKSAASKKAGKAHAPSDAQAANDSANNSDNSQMSANNPPAGDSASTPPPDNAATTQAPPPPPAPKRLIIDQGTQLTVRLIDPIDSEKNQTGDTFHATLNAPLSSDGKKPFPRESN